MRRLALILPLALAACSTAPTPPPPGWHPTSQGITRAADGTLYAPQSSSQSSAPYGRASIAIGDSMAEVEAALGSAERIPASTPNVWWYQNSSITFQNGRVASWDNASGNLRVKENRPVISATKPAPQPSPQPRPNVRPVAFHSPSRMRLPAYSGGMAYIGGEDGHWIESNSGNGKIITLEDGSIWKVDAVDAIDSALWLPTSDISVVETSGGTLLINTDDGEKVHATLIDQ